MRDLLPGTEDLDPFGRHASLSRRRPDGRPWLLVNMVASADGAATVDGRSGDLGGEADRRMFSALRAVADTILVGAATVRAEGYRPPRPHPEAADWRRRQGWPPAARVAVVSRRLDLDPGSPLFASGDHRPIVMCPAAADPDRVAALAPVADVVTVGEGAVDFGAALATLGDRGARVVLCEGGPCVNGQLVTADLVDELCLTVSPYLVSGLGPRITTGPEVGSPQELILDSVAAEGGALFLRYLRAGVELQRPRR